MFGKIEYGQRYEGESQKLDAEWEALIPMFNNYNSNQLKFYENIDKGLMNITPEELWEMQKEEGIDKYIEYNKNFLQR